MKKKKLERHEKMYGPHFNEECALKVVAKMENEDGTIGQHWSISETTTLASRYSMPFSDKVNRYDWYVALNMVYSDYYSLLKTTSISDTTKFFVELAKAWLKDKDVEEGKMWYYYKYVMCDTYHEDYDDEEDYEEYPSNMYYNRKYNRDDYKYGYHDYNSRYDREYNRYEEPLRERITSRY